RQERTLEFGRKADLRRAPLPSPLSTHWGYAEPADAGPHHRPAIGLYAMLKVMSGEHASTPVELAHEREFTLAGVRVRPPPLEVLGDSGRDVLEPRVMQVLVALARSGGEVVSRDDLIQACWGGRVVGDDAINRCIARLRRLADRFGGFAIETV